MINFERLNVYQEAVLLTTDIYKLTKKYPKDELFGLVGQMRRAAVSVPLNIAEGSSRTKKDFRHFLTMAVGSCYELVALYKVSLELGLLSKQEYDKLYVSTSDLAKRINALRKSMNHERMTMN